VTDRRVYGLVLAGGKSRRMGHDKALLLRDGNGQSQLAFITAILVRCVDKVFVSTRADQNDDERGQYEQIVDRYSDIGPIAGILSAIEEHPEVDWLVVACDLPNIDAATLACLLEQCSAEHPVTAYESIHDGLPEPLCAIYRPDARAMIDGFVEQGIICPRKMLINSDTHLLTQLNPGALHNINSPEDLAGTGIDAAL